MFSLCSRPACGFDAVLALQLGVAGGELVVELLGHRVLGPLDVHEGPVPRGGQAAAAREGLRAALGPQRDVEVELRELTGGLALELAAQLHLEGARALAAVRLDLEVEVEVPALDRGRVAEGLGEDLLRVLVVPPPPPQAASSSAEASARAERD